MKPAGEGSYFSTGVICAGFRSKGGEVKEITASDLSESNAGNFEEKARSILLEGHTVEQYPQISFKCGALINTAGAWAPRLSELYGFKDESIKPRRSQMVVLNCPEVDLSPYGMVIDTSDIYFHKESRNILAGYSNMDEPYGYNFEFSFGGMEEGSPFVKHIWEPLWKRISRFEKVKLIRG